MDCPCTADCPDRSPRCHSTCSAFKAYDAERIARGNEPQHSGASDYLHEKGQKMREICRARRRK